MSKFCPMCNEVTNCTENCKFCLEEEENAWNEAIDFGGVTPSPRYAEPEYTSEQLENDPIAIEGARWDDRNYQHYMER